MDVPRRVILATLILLPGLAGCAAEERPGETGDAPRADDVQPVDGAPRSPLSVLLRLDEPDAFYGAGSPLALEVRAASPASGVRAGVRLAPGVSIVSGSLDFNGDLTADAPQVLRATVRASAPGDYVLRGWAERPAPLGSRMAPSDLLGVSGDTFGASTFEPQETYPAYRVALAATEATLLTGTVESPVDVNGRVALWLPAPPNGMDLVEGAPEWSGRLAADETMTFTWRVKYLADGTYTPTLYFYPDANLDGRLLSKMLQVIVEQGQPRMS